MTDWQTIWLGAIAIAVLVMAAIQVALVVMAARFAREAMLAARELRQEVRPLIEKAHRIADDASRATALAAAQVERVDRMLSSTAQRLDETLAVVQGAVFQPIRQGAAVLAGLRAALSVFRGWQHRHRTAREEEEALFVG